MGTHEKNLAYDFSLFEVKSKELDNVVQMPEQKKKKQINSRVLNLTFGCLFCSVAISVLFSVVYSQAKLTELNDQINNVNKSLEESSSVYTQLQMKLESELSLKMVEEFAKNDLDMMKISSHQTEYINLCEGDKALCINNSKKFSPLEKLRDIFSKLR